MAEGRGSAPTDFGVRDLAWAAFAVAVGGLFTLSFGWTLWETANGRVDLGDILAAPLGLLSAWWLGVGAWRRTVWGRRPPAGDEGSAG